MKRSTISFSTLIALVFALTAAVGPSVAAQEKPKDPLVGNWFCEDEGIKLVIRANGTLTLNDAEFAYKVKNGKFTVISDEGAAVIPYSLDGDSLTVEYEGREIVYARVKGGFKGNKANGSSGGEGIVPAFVGKWCYMANLTGTSSYMSSRCFTLYANGTYEYSAESSSSGTYGGTNSQSYDSGRWTATSTTLTAISNSRGRVVYPIVLRNHPKNGDPMIVVDGDAYVTATQRNPW